MSNGLSDTTSLFGFPKNTISCLKEILSCKDIFLQIDPKRASTKNKFRENIRKDLYSSLKQNFFSTKIPKKILQPGITEEIKGVSYCISHCSLAGGFLWLPQEGALGIDLEVTSRVTKKIANRICKEEFEFKNSPSPAHLWAAKEAVFKALNKHATFAVLSDIRIEKWLPLTEGIYMFSLRNLPKKEAPQGTGCVIKGKELTLGIFCQRAQLSSVQTR